MIYHMLQQWGNENIIDTYRAHATMPDMFYDREVYLQTLSIETDLWEQIWNLTSAFVVKINTNLELLYLKQANVVRKVLNRKFMIFPYPKLW